VVVAEFDHELASLTHEEFLARVLADTLKAKHVVVGSNFRFGKDRRGDVRYLSTAAPGLAIQVSVVSSVIISGGPVSSTRVRALVGRGDVADAAKLLGRRFALRGTVVQGQQIGRKIGFPTANIQPGPRQLLPARGVYTVEAAIGKSVYNGVCNIGCRPTFGAENVTVEVHLMGLQGEIYGQTLDVVFCRRLRDEMLFESPDKLVEQIRKDLERVSGEGC
jgi:riboflavin kinase/FMN adenylyltransferase